MNSSIRKSASKSLISVLQLGTIDYATGLRLQQRLVDLRKEEKIGDVLLLLQHTPVITLGRNAKASNVIASSELLAQREVELFESDRGGDVTFHGPGQLVGYPIFDLRGFALSSDHVGTAGLGRPVERSSTAHKHLGAVDFVRSLEEVLIRTCADFAIPTKRLPGLTGVWTHTESTTDHVGTAALGCPVERRSDSIPTPADRTRLSFRAEENDSQNRSLESRNLLFAGTATNAAIDSKLAAIGVHISHFVTSHGFALNVNTDLSYFNLIIPCGITSKPVTSMQKELGHPLDLNSVAESVSRNFGVIFQSQILWVDTLDALLCGAGAPAGQHLNALP